MSGIVPHKGIISMRTQTSQVVFQRSRPVPSPGLSVRIIGAIEAETVRRLRFRLRVASACSFLSLALFFASLALVGRSFFVSDFWQLAGLLFSDLTLILSHSETFFLSLAETFPAASATILLLPLFASFAALSFRSRYMEAGSAITPLHLNTAH